MSLPYRDPVPDGYFAAPFVMEAPASRSRYVAIGTGSVHGDRVFEVLVSDDLMRGAESGREGVARLHLTTDGLRWQDTDLEAGLLRTTQQVVQLGWATEVGAPKTHSGARTVSLDARTVAVLRAWRATQAGERRAWGGAWQDTGLVFTREDGSQLHPDTVTTVFEQLHRAAGLPPIRLHDLRHTAASLALAAGVPLKVVSEQLGHSSLAITADTCTSVLPAVAQVAAEAVADVIPRASAEGADARPFPSRCPTPA